MTQYSKSMVIVHWLTLALLIAALVLGGAAHDARHEGSATVMGYLMHAAVGGAILLLTLARLLFRRKDGVPPALGDTPMDKLAKGIHYLLYIVLVLLPVTGMMQIATSDIGKALLSGDMTLLPEKMEGVVAHNVHEGLVPVLLLLVVVHLLGALKHQFVMKDGLMERMSLRKKD
jgi:cytochrome b561